MMKQLDKLISSEEKKVDELYRIRSGLRDGPICETGETIYARTMFNNSEEVDRELEKAHRQLSIYKIRKMMGF